ncbi:RHS repeat-associated core domain-containing protein [Xylanimonas sp. McL0601]|uniref:RHS repeat-associated core domain-containing protein n=1 Tax=Xylanimonas sp. McL0601 TaxID=3414739 RepID=UPI003CF0C009
MTGTDPASVSVYGSSIGGDLGFTVTDGQATLDLADPHGDTITTVAVPATGNATGIGAVACYDEYGNQATDLAAGAGVDGTATTADPGAKTGPNTGALAYGWLGAKQRATDASGLVLMGARLYNAVTGQFTSRDPVPGGNTTAYAYPQDPVNGMDLQGLMAEAVLVAAAFGGSLSLGTVLLIIGAAVLATVVIYAAWYGLPAAGAKLRNIYYQKKQSKKSGKESASDIPSWAHDVRIRPGESTEQAIKRIMGARYPAAGNKAGRGPGSDYSKIKKRLTRR